MINMAAIEVAALEWYDDPCEFTLLRLKEVSRVGKDEHATPGDFTRWDPALCSWLAWAKLKRLAAT